MAFVLGLAASMLGACAPPAAPAPQSTQGRKASKEALFGDPSLVPTRAGEQARLEIALARTIEEHLSEDPHLAAVRVHVAAPRASPAQVVISLQGQDEDAETQEERAREVAAGILGEREALITVDRIASRRGAEEPAPPQVRPLLNLALALALLALGAGAGISVDRLRRRRARA